MDCNRRAQGLPAGGIWALGALLLAAPGVWACQIPVFRYALERWEPDPYRVIVLHQQPLGAAHQALVDQLELASSDPDHPANVTLRTLEADAQPDAQTARMLEQIKIPPQEPWMVVLYPPGVRTDRVAFNGPLSAEGVKGLLDSPVRREITRRLIDGESAVWVLLESGDPARDAAAEALLKRQLERMQEQLELPSIEDIRNDEFYSPQTQVELRLAFSLIRVSREDPAEQVFASILLNSEPDLYTFQEPIAVPVFGRGRSYFALVGKGINAENIEESSRFLVGACSCQVKDQNPGADLLFAFDWNLHVKGSAAPLQPLPELTGLGALQLDADPPAAAAAPSSAVTRTAEAVAGPMAVSQTSAPSSWPYWGWLPIVVGVGLMVVLLGTILMKSSASRSQETQ